MRRLLTALAVAALPVGAAGCGEDAGQHAARLAVQQRAGGARTRCTQTGRLYFTYVRTTEYVCVADRPGDTLCDEYLAIRRGRRVEVRLRRREVDCVLPGS